AVGAPAFPCAKLPINAGFDEVVSLVLSALPVVIPFSRAISSANSSGKVEGLELTFVLPTEETDFTDGNGSNEDVDMLSAGGFSAPITDSVSREGIVSCPPC